MKDDPTKPTNIYGASDDLIEIDGGISGEHGCYNTTEDRPCMVFLSDGTVVAFVYAPADRAIWKAHVQEQGSLFDRLDICTDENVDPHSDVVRMRPGIAWAYAIRSEGAPKRVG